jgi:hypothetical protein
METDSKKLAESLDALHREFADFRAHYLVVNERYSQSLATLKGLTTNAKTAAMRAAASAKHSLDATNKAYEAVKDAANQSLQSIVRDAADAAWAAAEAASQSAASAAESAAVCAAAVAQQAEEISVQAASQASQAASAAASAAAEAVSLSRKAAVLASLTIEKKPGR